MKHKLPLKERAHDIAVNAAWKGSLAIGIVGIYASLWALTKYIKG